MGVAELLDEARAAVRAQSWREAAGILSRVDHAQLGSLETDLFLLVATVRRHQGDTRYAEQLYRDLRDQLSLRDERLADVIMGLAECARARGALRDAGRLAQAARHIPTTDPSLDVRLACSEARIRSSINVEQAVELFELLLRFVEPETTDAWAHISFHYADAMLVAGQFAEALPELLQAQILAERAGALVTTADVLRRLPLVQVLNHQDQYLDNSPSSIVVNEARGHFIHARQLYEIAGDRGRTLLYTEEAETFRGFGLYDEAEAAYTEGLRRTRDLGDGLRTAHNLLGLFELSRTAGQPLKWQYLDEAERLYRSLRNDWGGLHVRIARMLADERERARLREEALELVRRSSFSSFSGERRLLQQFGDMTSREIERYPHLLNYP